MAVMGGSIYGAGSLWLCNLLLAPPPRVSATPLESELAERTQVLTRSGLSTPVWIVQPHGEARACVLLFHGRGGEHSTERMQWLSDSGFIAVALDFRAHGEGPDAPTGFGYWEAEEVVALGAYAQERWPEHLLIGWGSSMGAAAILFASEHSKTWAGVLLESVYSDLARSFRNRFEQKFPKWLQGLTWGPLIVAQWRSGLPLRAMRPIDSLDAFDPKRLFLVRGAKEWRVAQDEFDAMLAQAPGAHAWIEPDLGHVDFFTRGSQSYRNKVLDRLVAWAGR